MGIREAINQNKKLGYGVTAALVAGAAWLGIWLNSSGFPANSTKAFFTDDDGKTFFADNIEKVPPFDHNGKTAHQAMVYRAGSNPPFVAYLQSFKPETAKAIAKILSEPLTGDANSRLNDMRADPLVKKPGSADWHKMSSAEGAKIATVQAPAGQTGDIKSVQP